MDFNFDILLAGCNTNCRHCYVNGGPSNLMATEDFDLCITKLLPVFTHFGGRATFTPETGLYMHPDLLYIFSRIQKLCWKNYYHHGSTSGIAFNHRRDKDAIWNFQNEQHIAFSSVTFHGAKEHHNEITRNPRSFDEGLKHIQYVKENQGAVYVSLMLSALLVEDRDKITELLQTIAPEEVYFAVPNFAPTQRMLAYQPYRVTYEDAMRLKGYLSAWLVSEEEILSRFNAYNTEAIFDELKRHSDFSFLPIPKAVYLSVHQNLDLYYGNTGVETAKLGNLRTLSSEDIIVFLLQCRPNYNFFPSCFHNPPSYEAFLSDVARNLSPNYIYPNIDSFISYHLLRMNCNRTITGDFS